MRSREKLRRVLAAQRYNTARTLATKYSLADHPQVRAHVARLYREQESAVLRVSDVERRAMIATCDRTLSGLRNAALLSQPLRARDLRCLTVADAHMTPQMVRWITATRISSGYVLRTIRFGALGDSQMSAQSIASVIRVAAANAGISGHITGSSLERLPYEPKPRPASTYLRKD